MNEIELAIIKYDGNNNAPFSDLIVEALKEKRNRDKMREENIASYMEQFKVSREQAITEIKLVMDDWGKQMSDATREVYKDIIRGML